MRKSNLTSLQRSNMIQEIGALILNSTPRMEIVKYIVETYGYSPKTTNDLISEGQKAIAKSFTNEELEVAKQQIKHLAEKIMSDDDEFSMGRIKAAELLMKIMKLSAPETAIQNNTINLNVKDLTMDELKQLLGR